MGQELAWGRRYLMVRPEHFRVEYAINPFMDPAQQPDRTLARTQWDGLEAAITAAGGSVARLAGRADSPDMVYAMNLALAIEGPGGPLAVLSHMRYPQRRRETGTAATWFTDRGTALLRTGSDGVGAHFEAGDAFAWRGDLVVGFGPRTDALALKHLAGDLDVRVHGFRTTHPAMYHFDLAFCPLDSDRAIICPAAFDPASAERLVGLVPEPLLITEAEAMTFCANSVVVGRTVIMPACPDRVRGVLEAWGFVVVVVDVTEFALGGGAVRCLTNPLDLRMGRDLLTGRGEILL